MKSLFDNGLVFMNDTRTQSFTDTLILAKELDRDHRKVRSTLDRLVKNGHIWADDIFRSHFVVRGKKVIKYDLTLKATTRLIMSLGGEKAEALKTKFNNAFYEQSIFLSDNDEWNQMRNMSKETTKLTNETIDNFIKLAVASGSKGFENYRHMFHKQINQVIANRDSITRNEIPKEYLEMISYLEGMADMLIGALISNDMHYKTISVRVLATVRGQGEFLLQTRGLKPLYQDKPVQGKLL